jgi:hypothetical protein
MGKRQDALQRRKNRKRAQAHSRQAEMEREALRRQREASPPCARCDAAFRAGIVLLVAPLVIFLLTALPMVALVRYRPSPAVGYIPWVSVGCYAVLVVLLPFLIALDRPRALGRLIDQLVILLALVPVYGAVLAFFGDGYFYRVNTLRGSAPEVAIVAADEVRVARYRPKKSREDWYRATADFQVDSERLPRFTAIDESPDRHTLWYPGVRYCTTLYRGLFGRTWSTSPRRCYEPDREAPLFGG